VFVDGESEAKENGISRQELTRLRTTRAERRESTRGAWCDDDVDGDESRWVKKCRRLWDCGTVGLWVGGLVGWWVGGILGWVLTVPRVLLDPF
jgi:hypothetical protein